MRLLIGWNMVYDQEGVGWMILNHIDDFLPFLSHIGWMQLQTESELGHYKILDLTFVAFAWWVAQESFPWIFYRGSFSNHYINVIGLPGCNICIIIEMCWYESLGIIVYTQLIITKIFMSKKSNLDNWVFFTLSVFPKIWFSE